MLKRFLRIPTKCMDRSDDVNEVGA
jgi:hypothetical protein